MHVTCSHASILNSSSIATMSAPEKQGSQQIQRAKPQLSTLHAMHSVSATSPFFRATHSLSTSSRKAHPTRARLCSYERVEGRSHTVEERIRHAMYTLSHMLLC